MEEWTESYIAELTEIANREQFRNVTFSLAEANAAIAAVAQMRRPLPDARSKESATPEEVRNLTIVSSLHFADNWMRS